MWVSGKHHLMNIDTLMEVAETPEEIELVSKVMIRYSRHCKEGYWFDDMKEPELSMVLLRADSGRCRFYSTSCKLPLLAEKIDNFYNSHIVTYELAAQNLKEAEEKSHRIVLEPYKTVGEQVQTLNRAQYYDILFFDECVFGEGEGYYDRSGTIPFGIM